MKKILGIMFALVIVAAQLAIAAPGNKVGSIDNECQEFGFEYGIAKWEYNGGWKAEGSEEGTSVSGSDKYTVYDAGSSGATGIVIKAGNKVHEPVDSTSGVIEQQKPALSHLTFCGGGDSVSCEEAIEGGLLTAEIVDGSVKVTNDAGIDYKVSVAVYEMFAEGQVEDQVLVDSETKTVSDGMTSFSVDVPACGYQLDVVCGQPLVNNPEYGNSVIEFEWGNQDNMCVPRMTGDVAVTIANGFPQNSSYVFECAVDFAATSYNWYFGDGNSLQSNDNATDNVYYTYGASGDYTVACTANDGVNYGAGVLNITVA